MQQKCHFMVAGPDRRRNRAVQIDNAPDSASSHPGARRRRASRPGVLLARPAGMHVRPSFIAIIGLFLAWPAVSRAQDEAPDPPEIGFVEAEGGWGFQLGELPYLFDGSPTRYKHPLVTGWSVGLTAGWFWTSDLAVIGSYQYRTASTREGSIAGVLDRAQGDIHYHTFALGVRLYHALGPGRLRSEFAAGLAFPFRTKAEVDYGPALAAAGIHGSGTMINHYNLGYGAQAQIGYELPVAATSYGNLYAAAAIELRVFQSTNNGRSTELDNFVTDLAAVPPVATTGVIENEDGAAQPRQYAVSDVTLRLAIGARF
jgi:hypothetical protein